jgi:hypothetical protein
MSSIATQVAGAKLTEQHAADIAVEAYIYLYPLVLMETTRRQSTNVEAGKVIGRAPVNEFCHVRMYPPADFKDVVRPNFDTLYSVAWLDLSNEPVVITIPDTKGRYYLLPMLDMWSDVFAAPGWRTSGTQAQKVAVVPPGWEGKLPDGVERVNAPTKYVWIIGRTKTDGPDDYASVHELQDGMTLQLLSQFGKPGSAKPFKANPAIDMKTPPMVQVDKMTGAQYFAAAAEMLKIQAPHLSDWSILARMARLGFHVGQSFDASRADAAVQAAIEKAPAVAMKLLKEKICLVGRTVNGWQINTASMGVYGNFYLQRAIVALIGLGANQPEDAIYPLNVADSDGKPLDAANKYVLHFGPNELPPVDAFWSLTMYDAEGFACANSLNRFAISSWMPLAKNADGSLDLYIQHENPGGAKEANWLPAPSSGLMGVTMRLYAPRATVLNGDWVPPVIKKV